MNDGLFGGVLLNSRDLGMMRMIEWVDARLLHLKLSNRAPFYIQRMSFSFPIFLIMNIHGLFKFKQVFLEGKEAAEDFVCVGSWITTLLVPFLQVPSYTAKKYCPYR